MNREQRRRHEKDLQKAAKQTVDITLNRVEAYDGAQRRINATMHIPKQPNGGRPVSVGYMVVVEPFIYGEEKAVRGSKVDIVGVDSSECLIMDIVVAPSFRRQGIGKFMVEGMKSMYDRMITGARTVEGKSLMERCGFTLTDQGQFVWIREKKVVEDEK